MSYFVVMFVQILSPCWTTPLLLLARIASHGFNSATPSFFARSVCAAADACELTFRCCSSDRRRLHFGSGFSHRTNLSRKMPSHGAYRCEPRSEPEPSALKDKLNINLASLRALL